MEFSVLFCSTGVHASIIFFDKISILESPHNHSPVYVPGTVLYLPTTVSDSHSNLEVAIVQINSFFFSVVLVKSLEFSYGGVILGKDEE